MNKLKFALVPLAIILIAIYVGKQYYDYKKTTEMPVIPEGMGLSEPQPEPEMQKIVKPGASMTFLLAKNDKIFYYKGNFENKLTETNYSDINKIITDFKVNTDSADLMFIIKSDKVATFKNAIDVLDAMSVNRVPPGHYAEVDASDAELDYFHNVMLKEK